MHAYIDEFGILDEKPTMVVKNMCLWYDGTFRPMRGHPKLNQTTCRWKFDGYIWWHL